MEPFTLLGKYKYLHLKRRKTTCLCFGSDQVLFNAVAYVHIFLTSKKRANLPSLSQPYGL